MKLQRYDIEPGSESMQPFPDGEYIKQSEALDWFESLLDHKYPVGDLTIHNARGIHIERARLRALIAAERGKV